MTETTTQQIRQGDVLLVRVGKPRRALRRVEDALGLRVPGERTGHAHVLPAEVYEDDAGLRFLHLQEPGVLTHEEHGAKEVPAGWWSPRLQREFSPSYGTSPRAMFD